MSIFINLHIHLKLSSYWYLWLQSNTKGLCSLPSFLIFMYVFIFRLHWVFTAVHRLSLVVVSGLLVALHRLWARGLQELQQVGTGAWAQYLRSMGLVAPWHVECSGPGIKPMSPPLADRFLFIAPPRKSAPFLFLTSFSPQWESWISVCAIPLLIYSVLEYT